MRFEDSRNLPSFPSESPTLHRLVSEAQAKGKTGTALGEALVPELQQKYGEWGFFNFFAQPNVLDIDAELRGTKRVPQ